MAPKASVVVCTWNRPDSLARCLASLKQQTEQRYELILRPERGPLAVIRNRGLSVARGPVVCFIDDDTVCPPGWLAGVLAGFRHGADVIGVSGPAIIPEASRQHRDLYRWHGLRLCYERIFIDRPDLPGHISRSGAPTLASSDATNRYTGPVTYLEACNMSFRTNELRAVGGFDEGFQDLAEWCEPDVCFRLRQAFPGSVCWYSHAAGLRHEPSPAGATALRRGTGSRLANYQRFAERWVPPSPASRRYRTFLRTYYRWLDLQSFLARRLS